MFERQHPFGVLLTIAVLLGIVGWFAGGSRLKDLAPYYIKRALGETAVVTVGNSTIKVEVARTEQARAKGLSGRDYLMADQGMVFLFPQAGTYTFTMAKTKISLDIIWVSKGTIVYIAHRAMPGEQTISPSVTADQVIEIRGDLTNQLGWRVGEAVTVTFDKK